MGALTVLYTSITQDHRSRIPGTTEQMVEAGGGGAHVLNAFVVGPLPMHQLGDGVERGGLGGDGGGAS